MTVDCVYKMRRANFPQKKKHSFLHKKQTELVQARGFRYGKQEMNIFMHVYFFMYTAC